ncbi:MAG: hypothetical protein HFI51_08790 [Lachnospiraceae bacterium]|nr:hypothetical protein [Lachnospiraceae bacterium]
MQNALNMKDIIEAISILVTFLLGILSIIISAKNSKKLKEMETYKHSLKMIELKIDTRYKNNQLLIEEVHMLLVNIKNLSCNSECYLFRNERDKYEKYDKVLIEARESLIWVQKRVNILSAYMDRNIYSEIKVLFGMVRNLLNMIDVKNYHKFLENYWYEPIYEIEMKGLDIIQKIQTDNEQIIESN